MRFCVKLEKSFWKIYVSSQAADKSENIAELGARLKSAKENSDWPEWLLNQAAGNYWRVVGAAAADIYIMMHVCLFVTKNDHFL